MIEQEIDIAALMLGSEKRARYCLEMICDDFLAGAHLEDGNPQILPVAQPLLTQPMRLLFRLLIEPSEGNGLCAVCRLMVDKITTVPKARVGARIGRLADEDMVPLNRAVLIFLGIAAPPIKRATGIGIGFPALSAARESAIAKASADSAGCGKIRSLAQAGSATVGGASSGG